MRETMTIKDVLVKQKPYRLLEYDENLSDLMDIFFSVDVAEEKNITVTVKGEGTVVIYKNGVEAGQLVLNGSQVQWQDTCIAGEKAIYSIENAACLTELDLRKNSITGFYVNRNIPLKKLVIYDNNLLELDCNHLNQLQFLHMFDNPVCENESQMIDTVNSLPDRSASATGSIIFYPWVGLETLIQEIEENGIHKYVKYPYEPGNLGNYSNPNGWDSCPSSRYNWVYENGNYKFEEDRLYAIVSRGNECPDQITGYGVYRNSQFLETDSENCPEKYRKHQRYQNLRRDCLEKLSLPKNWVFGSAIMYDEDEWSKCPWDFRQNHVADMWESAEKGFGLTLGTMDEITLLFPGSKYLNIVSFQDCSDTQKTGGHWNALKVAGSGNFWNGERNHGDNILSVICGNGADKKTCPGSFTYENCAYSGAQDDQRYGYVPHCKLVLLDKFITEDRNNEQHKKQIVSKFAELAAHGCNSLTSSSGYTAGQNLQQDFDYIREARKKFSDFSADNILTVCVGNGGDGKPYSMDSAATQYYDAVYGTNNTALDNEAGETGVIFTCALDRENRVADFSRTGFAAERSKFTNVDYMSQYGQFVPVYKNVLADSANGKILVGRMGYAHGTSYSAPMLNAVLMLMRIIYTKMKGNQGTESYGKHSDFMDHVRSHWCNRLPGQMDFACGYGMPDILAEPVENSFLDEQPAVECSSVWTVGEPISFTYNADAAKDGFTVGYDREMFALTKENILYPIRPSAQVQKIALYSNSARENVVDEENNESYYGENYYKAELNIPAVADNSELGLTQEEQPGNECRSFTVFVLVDFMSMVSEEIPWFVKFRQAGNHDLLLEASKGLKDEGKPPFVGKRLVWSVKDGDVTLGDELVCYPLQNYLSKYTTGVITITKSEEGMRTYFNGNRVSFVPTEEYPQVKYENMVLNQACSVEGIYSRVLSEDEIICNTAAILNYPATENNDNA